jgi:hypothetical protein
MKQQKSSRSELERLRAENMKLKAENTRLKQSAKNKKNQQSKTFTGLARRMGVVFLLALAVAVLVVGNVLFWTGNTIVKQDRFVAATSPIIKDPVVQQTMALYATNNIFANVDVQKNIEQVLPPRADFLAPQFTTQLKTGTQKILETALSKPKLQDKWNETNAKQHQRLINFASKYKGNGDISVNDVFNQLTTSLKDTKLAFLAGKQLPAKVGDVEVISAPWLPTFHKVVTNIDTWRILAIIILALCLVGAIWLSRNRRRTIYIFAIAASIFMFITLIALRIIRETVADKVDPQYEQGVRHIMHIVFNSLVIQTVTIMLAAIVIGMITWLSGPSRSAVAVKDKFSLLLSGRLHEALFGRSDNAFLLWIQKYKRQLQWSAVGVISIVTLVVRLTPKTIFVYLVLLILVIAIIEVLAGSPPVRKKART